MQNTKAVIDIGSREIKGIVIGEEDGKRSVLYKNKVKTKGIRKGEINDKIQLKESLRIIIDGINKKIGEEFIDEYIIGISHPHMSYKKIKEDKRIMTDTITNSDIRDLSETVGDIASSSSQELLKIIPVYRTINHKEITKNPQGLPARTLDFTADAFYIPRGFYEDLVEVIELCDIYVADIIPNIIANDESILEHETKDLGCVAIDIGKDHTTYSIYEDGYPIRNETIPMGGYSVTRDISISMQMNIHEAEKMKIEYGCIGQEETKKEETEIDKHFLNQIITARYEEILEKINDRLIASDKDGRLAGGIVLTGGGTKIKNIITLTRDIFQLAVYEGEDVHSTEKTLETNMHFVNVLGLYNWSERNANTKKGIGSGLGMSIKIKTPDRIKNIFQKLF